MLLAAAGMAAWFYGGANGEWSVEAVRTRVRDAGLWAPLVFMLVLALRPALFLPNWIVMTAGGLLFGPWLGTLWATLGATLGGLLTFGVARGLGREAVERRLRGTAARMDRRLGERGGLWIAVYCAMPITPLTPAFVGAGLSSLGAATFFLAILAGLLPRSVLFAYLGESIASGDRTQLVVASLVILASVAICLCLRWTLFPARREAPVDGPAPERDEES